MNQQYSKNSKLYFNEVDKIASESSYKRLELWEIQHFTFHECLQNLWKVGVVIAYLIAKFANILSNRQPACHKT